MIYSTLQLDTFLMLGLGDDIVSLPSVAKQVKVVWTCCVVEVTRS